MRQSILIFSVLINTFFTPHSFAQDNQGPAFFTSNMQDMMASMQLIQTCMAQVDQNHLIAIGQQAQSLHKSIQKLCEQGDSETAQQQALEFSKQLMNDTQVKKAQNCLKDLPDMMKGHIPFSNVEDMQEAFNTKDVCTIAKNNNANTNGLNEKPSPTEANTH